MKKFIKYLIATAVGLVATALVLLVQGFFTVDVPIIRLKMLTDAFFGPGIIMVLLSLLFWISTDGFFDGLTYSLKRLAQVFTFRGAMKQEKYYDYKQRQAEKRLKGFWFILFVGLGFVLVSVVFIIIYYAKGGTEAYKQALDAVAAAN